MQLKSKELSVMKEERKNEGKISSIPHANKHSFIEASSSSYCCHYLNPHLKSSLTHANISLSITQIVAVFKNFYFISLFIDIKNEL